MAKPKGGYTPKEAIEVGYKLMKFKAIVQHGEFIPRLSMLGYSESEASRLMRLAREFHGNSSEQLLEAVDTVSKLNELLALDDEEIDTLKTGGEVFGITLRSIKSMTVIQVRAAIRGVSELRVQAYLTVEEQRVLREYRKRVQDVQDVTDKKALAVATAPDLFSELPPPPPPLEIPKATGWHVAGLQFINPMGTWRIACPHVNENTQYATVTFRPAPARAGYRTNLVETRVIHLEIPKLEQTILGHFQKY
ncbi:MAG: DUF3102 domain-containing protein [Rhodoferax sp.]